MLEVSEAYKEEMAKNFRNPCHVKFSIDITDPTAKRVNTFSDDNHIYYSDVENIYLDDYNVVKEYATLEDKFLILDDSQPIPVGNISSDTLWQGYVSNIVSGEDGSFSTPPIVTIRFSQPVKFAGVSMMFDTIRNEYPADMDIKSYLFNEDTQTESLVDSVHYEPETSDWFEAHNYPYLTRMEIIFNATNLPYRRLRFRKMIYGFIETVDTSQKGKIKNIISCNELRNISLVNKTLPTWNVVFEINNTQNDFDPDSNEGILDYLVKNQEIQYQWGIENDEGEVIWVDGGNVVSDSRPMVSNNALQLTCTDRLTQLNESYKRGLYRPDGISLYDLAEEILTYADLGLTRDDEPYYILDNSLKTIYTKAPLPQNATIKSCLQLIASAGRCILYTNRKGQIVIEPHNTEKQDYYASLSMFIETPPQTELINFMRNAITEYYDFSVADTATQISTLKTVIDGTEDITIDYSAATDVSATVTGGTLNSATYYTNSCVLNITGTGSEVSVSINGKKITTSPTEVRVNYNAMGENASSKNPLICTYEDALAYAQFFADVIEYRKVYSGNFRGDPIIDVGDVIDTQTRNTERMESIVTNTNIVYQGSFDGDITFVKKED